MAHRQITRLNQMTKSKKTRRVGARPAPAEAFARALPRLRLWLSAAYLFLMPLLLYPGNTSYDYSKAIFSLWVISLLILLWLAQLVLQKSYRLDLTGLLWPGLLLIGAALLSLLHSTALRGSLQNIGLLIYFFLFALLIANTIGSARELRWLLRALLLSGALAATYGLSQYFGLLPGRPGVSGGIGAVLSSFGNKNDFAGFLAYLFVPGLSLLLTKTHWAEKLLVLLELSLFFLGLLVANSSAAWLAFALSVGFLLAGLWTYTRGNLLARLRARWQQLALSRRYGTLLLLLLGIAGLGIAGSLWGGRVVLEPISSKISSASFKVRWEEWQIALLMFYDHPLIGSGIGEYKRQYLPYKARYLQTPQGKNLNASIGYNPRPIYTHNEYIQIAAELGLLGLLAGAFLITTLFWSTLRRIPAVKSPQLRFTLLALLSGVVAFLSDAFFSFPLHLPANSMVLAFLLGALYAPMLGAKRHELQLRPLAKATLFGIAVIITIGVSLLAYRSFQGNIALSQARSRFAQGDYQQALSGLERSVDLSFAPAENLAWLARTYQALADGSVETQKRQMLQRKSINTFKRSLTNFNVERSYYQLATLLYQQGRYTAAERYLEQLLATQPQPDLQGDAQYLQVLLAFKRRATPQALELLDKLIKQHPNYERAYLALGQYQAQQGQYGPAKRTLAHAQEIIARKLKALQEILHPVKTITVPSETYYRAKAEKAQLQDERQAVERLLSLLP